MKAFYASRISEHRSKTPEGYLIALGVPIARTGYQEYKADEIGEGGHDKVQVWRDPQQVFNAATIASFEGKSITNQHPPVFLTPENDMAYAKGHAQNVRKSKEPLPDGEYALLADLIIKDAQLIQEIENGKEEISAGYECEYEPLGAGKFAQVKIVGNHVAIVASGRAGEYVRILDSATEPGKESSVDGTKEEVNFGVIAKAMDFLRSLGWKDPAQVRDAESEAVKRNEEKAKEANQLKLRVADDDDDKKAKDDDDNKKAKDDDDDKAKAKDDDKKAKDDDVKDDAELCPTCHQPLPEKEEKKVTTDVPDNPQLTRLIELLSKFFEQEAGEEAHGGGEEIGDDDDDGTKDADLIPVETLTGKEVPKNPIPGADKAMDELRALKPVIAATKNRKAIDAYNRAVRSLMGKAGDGKTRDGYSRAAKAAETVYEERRTGTTDEQIGADFVNIARQYHRQNPGEAKLKIVGKEKK